MFIRRVLIAGGVCFLFSAPANAQAWIGQMVTQMGKSDDDAKCFSGKISVSEENRMTALAAGSGFVRNFWAQATAIRQGNPDAKLSARWINGAFSTKKANAAFLSDPNTPRPEWRIVDEPVSFVRSGSSPNFAYGYWKLVSANDPSTVVGYYKAVFSRTMLQWGMDSISPLRDGEQPIASRFCNRPGDVEEYERQMAEKRAKKEAERKRRGGE